MKKVRKIILLIMFFIIAVTLSIRSYHYYILSKISSVTENLKNSDKPYFIKITEISDDGYMHIIENYKENSIAVSKSTIKRNEELFEDYFSWISLDEEFCNRYYANYEIENGKKISYLTSAYDNKKNIENEINKGYMDIYSYELKNETALDNNFSLLNKIENWIYNTFFYPAVSTEEYNGKECYVIDYASNTIKTYIDKESLLTVAVKHYNENGEISTTREYKYLESAPDGIYEKPNPEKFNVVNFIDLANNTIESNKKLIAEKPITGTNLKVGEQLIENIEITDLEKLNFLNLTPNEFGIIKFEIYNLETYNKFREKYSGLRELTEEDFNAYYVAIAYKVGEKLNYLEQYESKEAGKFNFVVNGEKTDKEYLLLAVIPNESGNRSTIFVESDEKLKINAEQAMNIAQESLTEIEKKLNLKIQTYIGYTDDHLDLLTKDEFANMEYIKTPIKGKEQICWNLYYRVKHEKINGMNIYVDAITGETIGAIVVYK